MTPSSEMMPDRYISATTSMIAEPQMPVTPVAQDGFLEAFLVRPFVDADDAVFRLQRFRIDAHALDRAGRGALAGRNLRALEGRAGGRRGRDHARAVAENDLGIGADIDQQHHPVLPVGAFRQRRAGGVGADMAGDAGQRVEARAAVDLDVDLMRPELQRARDGEREGRLAEFGRVDAEEQMVHDRIGDEDAVEDVVRGRRRLRRRPCRSAR